MKGLNVKYKIPSQIENLKDTGIKYNINNNYNPAGRTSLSNLQTQKVFYLLECLVQEKACIGERLAKKLGWSR